MTSRRKLDFGNGNSKSTLVEQLNGTNFPSKVGQSPYIA